MRSRRSIPVLTAAVLIFGGGVIGAGVTATSAAADTGACRSGDPSHPDADLFATPDTDTNTDPNANQLSDGLELFELQADMTIAQYGATVTGSTLVEGAFWSDEQQQVSYERSREFHLCSVDAPTLHTIAEALRAQFNQQSVLTVNYLPQNAPQTNAIVITVPDVDVTRFRDAFAANSAAQNRVGGGSVTTTDRTLVLVAGNGDLNIARRLVDEAGGSWNAATISYGQREYVEEE